MKTKHTPGQWVKGTNTSKRDWMQIRCNGKIIADVKELSKKGERKAIDLEEEGANAQLIMYAPELLQMVYDLKKCIERLTNDNLELHQEDKDKEAQWIGEAHELLHAINPDYYTNANAKP
jgi:hypothetical protein